VRSRHSTGANPPFSQNYTRSNMESPERFRWGWCPTTGNKGDLMFAQHMLAVCKPGGMVVTVMPHGVLFRGGAEKELRRKFLEQDLVEAVMFRDHTPEEPAAIKASSRCACSCWKT
jgi:type I restriction enzyme M protein